METLGWDPTVICNTVRFQLYCPCRLQSPFLNLLRKFSLTASVLQKQQIPKIPQWTHKVLILEMQLHKFYVYSDLAILKSNTSALLMISRPRILLLQTANIRGWWRLHHAFSCHSGTYLRSLAFSCTRLFWLMYFLLSFLCNNFIPSSFIFR